VSYNALAFETSSVSAEATRVQKHRASVRLEEALDTCGNPEQQAAALVSVLVNKKRGLAELLGVLDDQSPPGKRRAVDSVIVDNARSVLNSKDCLGTNTNDALALLSSNTSSRRWLP
jgi:hypothetical protein